MLSKSRLWHSSKEIFGEQCHACYGGYFKWKPSHVPRYAPPGTSASAPPSSREPAEAEAQRLRGRL
eukprot:2147437-Rhodomonas_salina.3